MSEHPPTAPSSATTAAGAPVHPAVSQHAGHAKPARLARHRNGSRTARYQGEAVTIELRDGRVIPAKIIDESPMGLALSVDDFSPFRPTQHLAIRRRGARLATIVRNVHSDAAHRRMGLMLLTR